MKRIIIVVIIIITLSLILLQLNNRQFKKNVTMMCVKKTKNEISEIKIMAKDGNVISATFDQYYSTTDEKQAINIQDKYTSKYMALDEGFNAYHSDIARIAIGRDIITYKVVAHSVADYSHFKVNDYILVHPDKKKYFDKNNNISLKKVIDGYRSAGAKCKKTKNEGIK